MKDQALTSGLPAAVIEQLVVRKWNLIKGERKDEEIYCRDDPVGVGRYGIG